jgi:hypothetical protein
VLVDAAPPALTADPRLARAGVTELPTWSVAVDGATVLVPPPLTTTTTTNTTAAATGGGGAGSARRLVGLVGLDACSHGAEHQTEDRAEHEAAHHPTNPGALLARFAARHPSNDWFHTVERLVADDRVHVTTDRAVAARRILRLLGTDDTTA